VDGPVSALLDSLPTNDPGLRWIDPGAVCRAPRRILERVNGVGQVIYSDAQRAAAITDRLSVDGALDSITVLISMIEDRNQRKVLPLTPSNLAR
jgi:hypothetical protein